MTRNNEGHNIKDLIEHAADRPDAGDTVTADVEVTDIEVAGENLGNEFIVGIEHRRADVLDAVKSESPDPIEYEAGDTAARVEYDAETYEILDVEVLPP